MMSPVSSSRESRVFTSPSMYLRDYAEYLRKDPVLTLRSAPKTRFGVSNVYNEIPIPLHSNALTLRHAWEVTKTQQTL